jgi:glycosidase
MSFSKPANLSGTHTDPATNNTFPFPDNLSPENYSTEPITPNKLVIYQILLRLFGNKNTRNKYYGTAAENGVGKFNDITERALVEIKKLGATHIWFTGLMEHATTTNYAAHGIAPDAPNLVKGLAGSPYAIKDYYDVCPDFAEEVPNRMAEWQALLTRTHVLGLKAIIDFIPNHVARSYSSDAKPAGIQDFGTTDNTKISFSPQNNFYYLPNQPLVLPTTPYIPEEILAETNIKFMEFPAKVSGNDVFSATPSVNDWFETIKLNYGIDLQNDHTRYFNPVPDTWLKMRHILDFWARQGVDGFRCDMAEMVPVEFWAWVIPQIKALRPGIIFIAEIYQPHHYHSYIQVGQFDFLYDKVGLYDSLRRLITGNGETSEITRAWSQESRSIASHMLRFLENHDEQRIASKFFAGNPWSAVPAMTLAATLSTGPVLIYSGQEVGEPALGSAGFQREDGRTTIFDYWGVPEHQKWMNGGLFDGAELSNDQINLREFYSRLLNLSHSLEAIKAGYFYLLNPESEAGHKNNSYAYLRFTATQKLIIILNFDLHHYQEITIPLSMAEKLLIFGEANLFTLTDLLTISPVVKSGDPLSTETNALKFNLPPFSAYIFRVQTIH